MTTGWVDAAVAAEAPWMERILVDLVEAPTLLGHEEAGQAIIARGFADCGLEPVDVPMDADAIRSDPHHSPFSWGVEGKRNVVATWPGSGAGRSLVLNGHVDVVPPASEALWTGAPFAARREGDWLYGRGAGDMKAGLVAMTGAVRALRRHGVRLQGDVHLQSVVEEECTGNGTLQCLLAGAPAQADAAVLTEPHHDHFTVAQVGVLWFHVDVRGVPAHAARASSLGHNALEGAQRVLAALRELEAELNAERPGHAYYRELDHPINLNPGVVAAGDWVSTVPAECTLSCRLALYPGQEPAELRGRVERTVAGAAAGDPFLAAHPPVVRYDGFSCEGSVVAEDEPVVLALAEAYAAVHGTAPALRATTATTDARHFVRRGIPAICFGPEAQEIHGIDERVSLRSMQDVARVLARFLLQWSGVSSDVGPSATAATSAGAASQLHRRALGVPDLVFFIVAASAPLTAVAGGQAATYLVTGNKGIPFLFIPLAIILGIFAVGYAAMSHHVADAGAFYTYVTRGLGRIPGVGTAFGALVSYNAMQTGIYGLFGVATAAFMSDKVGITMEWYWWCLIGGVVIAALGVLQVDLNARVLAVFLVLEVLVVAIFDFAILADPGPQGLTGTGFSPSEATDSALGAALVFCVASFVGFESAAIYSEECKDPKRTVARATFIAVALIGVFYALSSWFLANSVGPDTIVNPDALVKGGFTTPDGAAPDPTTVLFIAGQDRLGAFWGDSASLLFCTSLFAALLSFHNGVARYFFALGRERVFPAAFGRVSPRTGAPVVGSLTQSAIALVVVGTFAIAGADPVLKLFTWLTNLGALGVLVLMTVTSFAVVAFFRGRPDPGLGAYRTTIAPVIAAVLMLVIVVLGVTNFNVLITGSTDAPTDSMSIVLPAILLGAGLLGMAVAAWMRGKHPDRYAHIGERTTVEQAEHVA